MMLSRLNPVQFPPGRLQVWGMLAFSLYRFASDLGSVSDLLSRLARTGVAFG